MGCGAKLAKTILMVIVSILKILVAVAIIVIVAEKLYNVDFRTEGSTIFVNSSCLMGTDYGSVSLCAYAYAAAGLSIIVSGLIALFLCCTCNLCGLGSIIEVALAVVGTAWWIAAAIVFNDKGVDANEANLPEEQARITVMVLAWVEVGLFGFTVLVALVSAINCLRKCLCCCCDDDDDERKK